MTVNYDLTRRGTGNSKVSPSLDSFFQRVSREVHNGKLVGLGGAVSQTERPRSGTEAGFRLHLAAGILPSQGELENVGYFAFCLDDYFGIRNEVIDSVRFNLEVSAQKHGLSLELSQDINLRHPFSEGFAYQVRAAENKG